MLCLRQAYVLASEDSVIRSTRDTLVVQQVKAKTIARQLSISNQKILKIDKEEELFALTKKGKQKDGQAGHLSTSTIFSIGLRRCMTRSAADFGVIAMYDFRGQTVIRREQRTAAGFTACSLMRPRVCRRLCSAHKRQTTHGV